MLNSYSTNQLLAIAGIAILVLTYVAFILVGVTRYHQRSQLSKNGDLPSAHASSRRASSTRNNPNQVLPNGYRRKDYHSYGYSDYDIEFLGLDQPSAPDPFFSGWVMADMADGDLDGEIDFF